MSHYLTERIEGTANITVKLNSRVTGAEGDARLETLLIADTETGDETRLPADGLFILIGAEPLTNASEGWLKRDEHGFLITGPDLLRDDRSGWPLKRDPLPLESNQPACSSPATFVTARSSASPARSVKARLAITLIHQHRRLSDEPRSPDSLAQPPQVVLVAKEQDEGQ